MPILYAIFALLTLIYSVGQSMDRLGLTDKNAELESTVKAMLLYRNSVSEYRYQHDGFEGQVPDEELGLPVWFFRAADYSNYISAGVVYVYYPNPPAGLVGALAERVESVGVGVNKSGSLTSPMDGDTGIPLPSAIPMNSLVILQ